MRTLIDLDDAPVFAIPSAAGPRYGVLVEGPQGWGEFSPPPEASDEVAARWLTAAMEPSTVGWPDALRGRVPVDADRAPVSVGCDGVDPAVDTAVAHIRGTALDVAHLLDCTAEQAAAIRRRVDVPIAVDADVLATDPQCADVVALRCGSLGGVRRAMRRAERLGMPALVAFSGTTSIGVAADVALAAALPDLPYPCGPVPPWLRDGDVVSNARTLVPADGYLPAAPMPAGPDAIRLARFRVTDAAVVAQWRDMLRRAAALL
ncbi:MAG: O-succinylbenzoate-CoA synthase [Mycobacterium kyogaense]|uniref:O-succinylbenzoate-CoA synthase n=1 Tax=Mycobacterium kyogaense TaxID=2212479 RepID=UPI002FF5D2EB